MSEWKWEQPLNNGLSWVVISEDQKQVTFHPFYSSGTAAVRGDTPMLLNHHYYWEVKMLTDTYGTDIVSDKFFLVLFSRTLSISGIYYILYCKFVHIV